MSLSTHDHGNCELCDDQERRIATLEADLAAMRGALECCSAEAANIKHHHHVGNISLADTAADRIKDASETALDSSPGAAWLVTAREVVEALDELVSAVEDGERRAAAGDDRAVLSNMIGATKRQARALLARPEVQEMRR